MVYIGGGCGHGSLARPPLAFAGNRTQRAQNQLLVRRQVRQEIFYDDYFAALVAAHRNFRFELALSSPLPDDKWTSHVGFIHEVVLERYLKDHPTPAGVEYYLCGPPMMIKACNKMLAALNVPDSQIAFDEF